MQVLLIPPLAVAMALIWQLWQGRDRKVASPIDSVAHFRRSMRALAPPAANRRPRQLASSGTARRPR